MRNVWGQGRRICSLIVGVKGLKKAMIEKKTITTDNKEYLISKKKIQLQIKTTESKILKQFGSWLPKPISYW